MKRAKMVVAGIALFSASVLLAACGEAGSYFDTGTVQLRNDKVGRLEAVGEDLRIYEFTPQTDRTMQCVFAAGENKGGLQCWKKTNG